MKFETATVHNRHTIIVTNRQDKQPVTPALLLLCGRLLRTALDYEGFRGRTEVSLTFVDNEQIHELNREYRNVDRPTDVLSFPMDDEDLLGDIVISLERAQEQAQEYGHSFRREVAFLFVHSVLHLLGYDHETSEEDEKLMFAHQEAILRKMGIGRD